MYKLPILSSLALSRSLASRTLTPLSSRTFSSLSSTTSTSYDPSPLRVPPKFTPYPFEYHEELTFTVDALTNLGVGVCRVDITDRSSSPRSTGGSWVVFVPSVIVGETVTCRIYRNHASFSNADLLTVVTPSPHRVAPLCPIYHKCGGCQYQHIATTEQRLIKQDHVVELFNKIGGIPNAVDYVRPTVGTPKVYQYRSKITPHYDAPRVNTTSLTIGFQSKGSRIIQDVTTCAIATTAINDKYQQVRVELDERLKNNTLLNPRKKKRKGATLLFRDVNEGVITDHNEFVTENVVVESLDIDLKFRYKAGNFFQNNPHVIPLLVEYVITSACAPASNGDKMTHLVDTYCGSGLFCLAGSSSFTTAIGIEVNDLAIEEAKMNAELNGIDNAKFICASAEKIFAELEEYPNDNTVVVIDPPRKGSSEEFLAQLVEFAPRRLVYMSCGPDTQARDTKFLLASGKYELREVVPFDLFPQTRHVESCAVFERID